MICLTWTAAKEYARLQVGVAILPKAVLTSEDEKVFTIRNLGQDFVITDRLICREDDESEVLMNSREMLLKTFNLQSCRTSDLNP